MRFESSIVMEMLQRLEQVGSEARPYAADLAAALSFGGYHQAVQVSGTLHRALEIIEETKASLSTYVVLADGLGEPGDCLGELAIRSRAMVIVDQLGRVRDALRDPAVRLRAAGWFTGRFRHIDSVASFIQDELQRIHDIWRPYRPDLEASGTGNVERLAIYRYRITVRLAQQALEEIAEEPDFAYFLKCAASAEDCPEPCSACRAISAVFAIRIDMGPRSAAQRPSRPRSDSGAADAWSPDRRGPLLHIVGRFCFAILRRSAAVLKGIARTCLRRREDLASRPDAARTEPREHRPGSHRNRRPIDDRV